MGSRVYHALRALCFNNQWSYAVFWRLQHQAQMVLTCEDAFYNNIEQSEKQQYINGIQDSHSSSDPLLLALGKMSYHVYSLGEGIVGQVVVSGKHLWISSDADPSFLFENCGGYQSQFAAGIKTIAFVAVVPYGVVQLGSFDRIAEDIRMVNHVRNVFFCSLDSTLGPTSSGTGHPHQASGDAPLASVEFGNFQGNLDPEQKMKELGPVVEPICEIQSGGTKLLEGCVNNVSYSPSDLPPCGPINGQNIAFSVPNQQVKDDLSEYMDKMDMSSRFCAGYELYEVLGAAFPSRNIQNCVDVKLNSTGIEIPEERIGNSHTLEAMVSKVGPKDIDIQCKMSVESLEPCSSDVGTVSSAGYSFNSSREVSCTSSSKVSGLLDKSQESSKAAKKRARPGESCRPRPRDRQLIQDRIKELRDLVPNGSKCSIDSLLEKTIKHMLFMQSITKHGEKLKKCAALKVPFSSCNDAGSSWAVEVGSNEEVCPIIVENLNMNGLLLIEMTCDSSSHFLEVAEAIRNMGLTILKGLTQEYGEKTWARLVVESESSRSVHRMDVLWCLMKLLQPQVNN